jgi:hypothetical protein
MPAVVFQLVHALAVLAKFDPHMPICVSMLLWMIPWYGSKSVPTLLQYEAAPGCSPAVIDAWDELDRLHPPPHVLGALSERSDQYTSTERSDAWEKINMNRVAVVGRTSGFRSAPMTVPPGLRHKLVGAPLTLTGVPDPQAISTEVANIAFIPDAVPEIGCSSRIVYTGTFPLRSSVGPKNRTGFSEYGLVPGAPRYPSRAETTPRPPMIAKLGKVSTPSEYNSPVSSLPAPCGSRFRSRSDELARLYRPALSGA